ncbi:carbohydrate ABC transporter permease [Streptacidiphilus sp. PB12-B1b]|uniref:carbohydrate ABC transporter permease n=1 Tax=Streptacidiphilus sp. PB12-B1b TaxID=2705012 RepID=UPI0015FB49AA|nr:carbohydrate ABC transporter permease [Streptacidiphilus sp. PB12-B1b]QMU79210.1 carbohydrate ABC transporter permease [Streptacidiphilus sp. PB12-B1b]
MRRSLATRITFNTIALVLAVVFIFPVYWMIVTAFTPAKDLFSKTPVFFPTDLTFAHFRTVTKVNDFSNFWVNSLTATLGAVLISLVIALMASVAIARMRFRGRKAFILVVMVAQMAPWAVLQISVYMIVRNNNMLDQILPLMLFYMVMILPFTVWTLRNFVGAIPKELEESALIDGCNRVQAFWRIIFPLLAPGLMATSLFGFITAWGEFPLVLVLETDSPHYTLALWITSFQTQFGDDWGATMAAATLFAVPVLVLFIIMQRRAVGGLTAGAVKG